MSQKSCEDLVNAIAAEMKDAIVYLGGDRAWSDTRESWLQRAARTAGVSYRTAFAIFYGQGGVGRPETIEAIRAAVQAKREKEASLRADYRAIIDRIASNKAALRQDRAELRRIRLAELRRVAGDAG